MKKLMLLTIWAVMQLPLHAFPYTEGAPFRPSFDSFAAYMSGKCSVMLRPVKGFSDADCYYAGLLFSDKPSLPLGGAIAAYAGDRFGPIWYSRGNHCVIMYGWDARSLTVKRMVMEELNGNVADGTGNVAEHPETCFITAEPLSRSDCAEGDSLFVYQFPNPDRFSFMSDEFEKYNAIFVNQWPHDHCLGVIITRNGVDFLHFKLLLSDKGFRHKDKYIGALLKSIRFEE